MSGQNDQFPDVMVGAVMLAAIMQKMPMVPGQTMVQYTSSCINYLWMLLTGSMTPMPPQLMSQSNPKVVSAQQIITQKSRELAMRTAANPNMAIAALQQRNMQAVMQQPDVSAASEHMTDDVD